MAVEGGDVEVVLLPPGRGGRGVRLVSFKAPVELVERLEELARMMGKSRSEVIRDAIRHYIAVNCGGRVAPRLVRPVEALGEGW